MGGTNLGGGALYTPKLVHALRHCSHGILLKPALLGRTESVQTVISCNMLVTESVDSVCRDTTYTQYMLIQKNLSKSQKRYTYKPL